MRLTEYDTLLIDCDEVLVDRDSGVWTALQPLLDNRADALEKEQVLSVYKQVIQSLYPRFDELGFSGLLCFALMQTAERLGIKANWEEGMTFARSVPNWSLFEDAPGAMLYLHKFYHLLVCVDRDIEDRGVLCERLGLAPENLLSLSGSPMARTDWLAERDMRPDKTLILSRAPVLPQVWGGSCLMRRGSSEHRLPCSADFCINSMADLVRQHQLSLRR